MNCHATNLNFRIGSFLSEILNTPLTMIAYVYFASGADSLTGQTRTQTVDLFSSIMLTLCYFMTSFRIDLLFLLLFTVVYYSRTIKMLFYLLVVYSTFIYHFREDKRTGTVIMFLIFCSQSVLTVKITCIDLFLRHLPHEV